MEKQVTLKVPKGKSKKKSSSQSACTGNKTCIIQVVQRKKASYQFRPTASQKHAYIYNFDPHKPHFYIVKLGFTGCTLIFLFLLKNIDCGYSLEPPRRGGSNKYTQSIF